MNKWNADAIMGVLIAAFGLTFLVPALGYGLLPPPNLFGLGAGFFPTVTSVMVIFFGLWTSYNALKNGSVVFFAGQDDVSGKFKLMLALLGLYAAFLLLWYCLDFFVGIAVLLLGSNLLFGRTLRFSVIFTAVLTALLWVAFYKLLDINFSI